MPIPLADLEKIGAGLAQITGICRCCGVSLINWRDTCASCSTAPARITVWNSDHEYGHDVSPAVPKSAGFEYVRADLIEKMKDTERET